MTPLKITFRISGGLVAPPYPIHLDSLVAYVETQRSLHLLPKGAGIPELRALADNLPFGKYEAAGNWVWQASALNSSWRDSACYPLVHPAHEQRGVRIVRR